MSKTASRGKTAKWMKITTARDAKQSHTPGMIYRASDRKYVVQPNGSWKRVK